MRRLPVNNSRLPAHLRRGWSGCHSPGGRADFVGAASAEREALVAWSAAATGTSTSSSCCGTGIRSRKQFNDSVLPAPTCRNTISTVPALPTSDSRSTVTTTTAAPRCEARADPRTRNVRHVPAGQKGKVDMAGVVYQDASCVYPGADSPAVDKLNLDIADGEFLVL